MEIKPLKRPQTNEELDALLQEIGHTRAALQKLSQGSQMVSYFYKTANPVQAVVITDRGDCGMAVLPKKGLVDGIRRGDVVLTTNGVLTDAYKEMSFSGDIVTLERIIGADRAEVTHRNERITVWTSEDLHDKIVKGDVKIGSKLIMKEGPRIAFEALPQEEGLKHFRYLVTDPIPDIDVARDIGAPHECLEKIMRFIRMELTNPELHRKYGIRPLLMNLFEGVPGSGKTMHILAIRKLVYDLIAEVTGAKLDDIPRRELRMKSSQMLSMWLGESDKNFERFMDEAEEIANTPFKVGKKTYYLPVILILEEIDGIAAQRGSDGANGQVHDRILTTLLQRMDPTVIGHKPIVALATTNEPDSVDRAFLRRIGGEIAHFGMLCAKSFPAVLEKHVSKLPVQNGDGRPQKTLRKELVGKLTDLFFEAKQPPIVEVQLQGGGSQGRYRRDFLTAALVDRSVQQAARQAVIMEQAGEVDGVTESLLVQSFSSQIDSIVSQLNENNAKRYLDIPRGERVVKVKKV